MSGKAKIESLTNAWYGFAIFTAVCSVLKNGIGFFSIGGAIVGLLISFALTFFLGRRLIKKSGLTRTLLILISGILTLLGTYAVGSTAWTFMQSWQLSLLGTIGYSAVQTWMNARSLRTLMDASVKTYIG
jgi:hypothetical protein